MAVFYGWVIVGAAGLLYLCSAPGHTTGVNQFVEPWLADLSISRSVLAAIWTGASISSALLIPFFGSVLDVFGPRRSLFLVSLLYVATLIGLSFAASAPALAVGLASLRFFGPECLILTASFTINKWWAKQRGLLKVLLVVLLLFAALCRVAVVVLQLRWIK